MTESSTLQHAPNNEWWRGGVIYQIYPRSFADSNGDGIGDLPGITERLGYVAALGADAVWLSPFFKSPMKDFGYDVSDYCDVDPMFGTLDDFKALVARAHGLGLKVMIDQVLSHTADTHPWFAASRSSQLGPKADWYVWADPKPDGGPPNNWLSVFGGSAWQFDTGRCQYFLHNFLASQPDLNFHSAEVRQALIDAVRFWLDLGVDGFRLDTANFYFHDAELRDNPPRGQPVVDDPTAPAANPYTWQFHVFDKSRPENLGFLRQLRALLDEYPHTTMVGEIGCDNSLARMAEYTQGGDKLHMAYTFDLLGAGHDAAFVHATLSRFQAEVGNGWPSWALSNHDCVRLATRWAAPAATGVASARQSRAYIALQLSLRGSPCIYQGDELGLPEADIAFDDLQDPYGKTMWPRFKGRDGCRTPMPWVSAAPDLGFGSGATRPWLPVAESHRTLAADGQAAIAGSLLNHYRALLAWRRTQPALIKGDMRLLPAHPQVLALLRGHAGEQILCAFNLSDQPAHWALPQGLTVAQVLCPAADAPGAQVSADGGVQFDAFGVLFASVA